MAGPPPAPSVSARPPTVRLGSQERAVLAALFVHRHRVVSRGELARVAGLTELSERRADSLLVVIRRELGAQSVITVRSRGWRLDPSAVDAAHAAI